MSAHVVGISHVPLAFTCQRRFAIPFAFESLTVYKLPLDWIAQATQIAGALKQTELAPLADQLIRASTSISLNLAEGNGRWHKGDKKQFFWISRGSVFECVAITQAANLQKIVDPTVHDKAYATLESLSKMMTKIQSVDDLRGEPSLGGPKKVQVASAQAPTT